MESHSRRSEKKLYISTQYSSISVWCWLPVHCSGSRLCIPSISSPCVIHTFYSGSEFEAGEENRFLPEKTPCFYPPLSLSPHPTLMRDARRREREGTDWHCFRSSRITHLFLSLSSPSPHYDYRISTMHSSDERSGSLLFTVSISWQQLNAKAYLGNWEIEKCCAHHVCHQDMRSFSGTGIPEQECVKGLSCLFAEIRADK